MKRIRCQAKTKAGEPCGARPTFTGFCPIHAKPGRAAELGRLSGKARGNPRTEIMPVPLPRTAADLVEALVQVFSKVSLGQMDVKEGRGLAYIASILNKARTPLEQEVRLEALEQIMGLKKKESNNER